MSGPLAPILARLETLGDFLGLLEAVQHPFVLHLHLPDLALLADDFLDPAHVDLILPLPLPQLQLAQRV